MCEPNDPRVGYLRKLGAELLARGVKCELAATGCVPRLRLDIPWLGGFENSAFEDNIVAADEPDGRWRYWWPWVQAIAPVEDMAHAVDHICRNAAGTWDSDEDAGDGHPTATPPEGDDTPP